MNEFRSYQFTLLNGMGHSPTVPTLITAVENQSSKGEGGSAFSFPPARASQPIPEGA